MLHLFTELHLIGMREVLKSLDELISKIQLYRNDNSINMQDVSYTAVENTIGTGFVVLQTYMATVLGALNLSKKNTLSLGPITRNELTVAQTINHYANEWKHRNEEMWKKNSRAKVKSPPTNTRAQISPHPLTDALTLICQGETPCLIDALSRLEEWRTAVYATHQETKNL